MQVTSLERQWRQGLRTRPSASVRSSDFVAPILARPSLVGPLRSAGTSKAGCYHIALGSFLWSVDFGGDLVSTGVLKWIGACRGVAPRKTAALANLTANDDSYALAA